MVRNSPVEPGAAYDDGKDSERRAQRQMKTKFSQFDSAEPHPVFFKDSERRAQRQMKTKFSQFDSAEPHPVFSKDSERRAQRQMKTEFSQVDSAEPHPVFSKDTKRRGQRLPCPRRWGSRRAHTPAPASGRSEPSPSSGRRCRQRNDRLPEQNSTPNRPKEPFFLRNRKMLWLSERKFSIFGSKLLQIKILFYLCYSNNNSNTDKIKPKTPNIISTMARNLKIRDLTLRD